jgi:4-diphosphocytidyl-2-C-methyl-D-erythritol kinase
MPPRATLAVEAPAKLNLALSVGGPDGSGLHAICSWMITVDLTDTLTVTRLEEDRLSRYAILWHREAQRRTEIDWAIRSDLAVRAHLALEARAGRRLPVQMKLEKRIPVGAGLGGGSSDAAAMLRAASELFDLDLAERDLLDIAATLGSDVPFLVRGGSAIVEGRGESIVRHRAVPEIPVVIAFPPALCPTGKVYAAFDSLGGGTLRSERIRGLVGAAPGPPPSEALFNDLTAAAIRVAPQLEGALRELSALAGRPAHVTGSGSALFVVCDDPLHAEALAAAVEDRLDMAAVAARTHEHADAAV